MKITNAPYSTHWKWILASGIVFILLGILAIAMPVASSMGVTLAIAIILLASGVVNSVRAWRLRDEEGAGTRYFQAIVPLVAGFLMFLYPTSGVLGVTLILAFYFFLSAAAQWILALNFRPYPGWGWMLASSIASLLLGVYIVWTFPISSFLVPGVLLGLDLIFSGAAMIQVSICARRAFFRPTVTSGPVT